MKRYALLAVLLASQLFAQAPVPTGLLPEIAVPAPALSAVGFSSHSIAARGSGFATIASRRDYRSSRHAWVELDADGRPLTPVTQIIGDCGLKGGVASDGVTALAVWGCLGGTEGALMLPAGNKRIQIHPQTRGGAADAVLGERSVAWDGQVYVVLSTLESYRSTPTVPATDRAIATVVTSSGEIVANDIDLGAGIGEAIAARNGVSVFVIRNAGHIVRTMTGGVVSPPRRLTSDFEWIPTIAAGSDGFLLAWSNEAGVFAQHLDASGEPAGVPFPLAGPGAQRPAVTAEGSGYRVAWDVVAANEIRAVRIASGSVIGTPAVVATGVVPALASNGATTMLVWNAGRGTRARPIDAEGDGEHLHAMEHTQRLQSLAMTPTGASIAWWETLNEVSSGDFSHLIDRGGHVVAERETMVHLRGLARALIIDGATVPVRVRYADAPDVAFDVSSRRLFWTGNGFLAVWDEGIYAEPFFGYPLQVQRFDAAGNALDTAPRAVGVVRPRLVPAYYGPQDLDEAIAMAPSSDEILLTYYDSTNTLLGVIIRDDQTIAVGPIAAPEALAGQVEVTSDGRDFLVTWISNPGTVHAYVASRRVLAGGAMEEMRIQTGADLKEQVATFWTGEHYLVVWSSVNEDGLSRTISGIRISPDGTLMDYPHRVIGTIEGRAPQFAYRNGQLVLAYERDERVWWRYAGTPRRRSVAR